MKIGVLTYWKSSNNYGQLLQSYALQEYLRSKGHEPYLLKYDPFHSSTPLWKKVLLDPISYFSIQKFLFLKKKREQKREALNKENEGILREKNDVFDKQREFNKFRSEYINTFGEVAFSVHELDNIANDLDFLICGSDQVWNIDFFNPNSAGWFLLFGPSNVKRMAYAPSFGKTELKKAEIKILNKYLSKIDYLSVREEKGVQLCLKAGRRDAIDLLDSTFLLDKSNYLRLTNALATKETIKKPNVFMYLLNVENTDDIYWDNIKNYIDSNGWDFSYTVSSGYFEARDVIPNVKPIYPNVPEWLSLINGAKFVVTTSFHGMVFCLIFNVPFLVILLKAKKFAAGNSRITNLLEKVGLSSRACFSISDTNPLMDEPIDWDNVNDKLEALKEKAYNFLSNVKK